MKPRKAWRVRTTGGQRNERWIAVALLVFVALFALPACTNTQAKGGSSSKDDSLYRKITTRGVLKVGVRTDNPPHGLVNAQGALTGFDVDIAKAIARRWHVRLELVRVDELTRISFLRNDKIDLAIASISKTKKRGQLVEFSQTYFFSKQSFLVRKGKVGSLRDLVGKDVGADRGSSAVRNWPDWLNAHGYPATAKIQQFGDKQAALNAVKQGAIAGWAEDYEVLASYAKNDPTLTVLDDPGGIGVKLDGIAMRKNDSALALAVNLALQDIAASGDYEQIYDRWFGPGSATPVPRTQAIEVWPNG